MKMNQFCAAVRAFSKIHRVFCFGSILSRRFGMSHGIHFNVVSIHSGFLTTSTNYSNFLYHKLNSIVNDFDFAFGVMFHPTAEKFYVGQRIISKGECFKLGFVYVESYCLTLHSFWSRRLQFHFHNQIVSAIAGLSSLHNALDSRYRYEDL